MKTGWRSNLRGFLFLSETEVATLFALHFNIPTRTGFLLTYLPMKVISLSTEERGAKEMPFETTSCLHKRSRTRQIAPVVTNSSVGIVEGGTSRGEEGFILLVGKLEHSKRKVVLPRARTTR